MKFFNKKKECDPIKEFRKELEEINPPDFSFKEVDFYYGYNHKDKKKIWKIHVGSNWIGTPIDRKELSTYQISFIAINYEGIIEVAKKEKYLYDEKQRLDEEKRRNALKELRDKVC